MKYDTAVARLKEILLKLERDDIDIAESIKLYEEGLTLSKECMVKMEEYKGKATVLRNEYNKLVEAEFDKPSGDKECS